MVKRARGNAKATSKSKTVALVPAQVMLFGAPQLLEDEDAAAYDGLLARFRAAAKPVDIIDEMFIVDVVALEWEVLRWRRLKLGLIQGRAFKPICAITSTTSCIGTALWTTSRKSCRTIFRKARKKTSRRRWLIDVRRTNPRQSTR